MLDSPDLLDPCVAMKMGGSVGLESRGIHTKELKLLSLPETRFVHLSVTVIVTVGSKKLKSNPNGLEWVTWILRIIEEN